MRPASSKDSSGTIDQVTDSAVRAVSAASAARPAPPLSGPAGLQMATAATPSPPSRTSTSSTAVVLPSSVPPAAPKATPAKAAPSRMVLAARACERDTGQGYARHRYARKRNPRQRRHATSEGIEPAGRREHPDCDQRQQQRQRQSVGRAGEVEQPVVARRDVLAADVEMRLLAAVGQRVEIRVVFGTGRVLGGLRGRGPEAARAAAVPAAALAGSARDRARDHRTAIAVLIEVGGQVLLGLLEVRVGVVVVELAVVRAVADHRIGTRVSKRRNGERHEKYEDVGDATHVQIPPGTVSAGAWE